MHPFRTTFQSQSGTMSATPASITVSVEDAVHTCSVQINAFLVELLYNGMSTICLSRTADPIPYVMVKFLINDGEFDSCIFCTILLSRQAAPSTCKFKFPQITNVFKLILAFLLQSMLLRSFRTSAMSSRFQPVR